MAQYIYRQALQYGPFAEPDPAVQERVAMGQLGLSRQRLDAQLAAQAAEQQLARDRLAQQAQQFGMGQAMGMLQLASGREQSELARMFQAEQAALNRRFQGRMDPYETDLLSARAEQARASASRGGMSASDYQRQLARNRDFAMKVRDYGNIKHYLDGQGVLPEQLAADVYAMATQLDPEWYRFSFGPILAGRSPMQFEQQMLDAYEKEHGSKPKSKIVQDQMRQNARIKYGLYVDEMYNQLARALWERNGRMGNPRDYLESAKMLVPDPYEPQRPGGGQFNEGTSTRPPVPSVSPENRPPPSRASDLQGSGTRDAPWTMDPASADFFRRQAQDQQRIPWSEAVPETTGVMPPPEGEIWRRQPGVRGPDPDTTVPDPSMRVDPLGPPMGSGLPPLPEGRQVPRASPAPGAQVAPPQVAPPVQAPAPAPTPREREVLRQSERDPEAAAKHDAYLRWREEALDRGYPPGATSYENWESMGMPGYRATRDWRGSDSRLDQAMERNLAMLPEVTRRALAQGSPRDVTGRVIPSGVVRDPGRQETPMDRLGQFLTTPMVEHAAVGMDLNALSAILRDLYQGNTGRAQFRARQRALEKGR